MHVIDIEKSFLLAQGETNNHLNIITILGTNTNVLADYLILPMIFKWSDSSLNFVMRKWQTVSKYSFDNTEKVKWLTLNCNYVLILISLFINTRGIIWMPCFHYDQPWGKNALIQSTLLIVFYINLFLWYLFVYCSIIILKCVS